MPDQFYVNLPKLDEYASYLKRQVRLMEQAGDLMMKKNREFSAVLDDDLTARVDEELKILQRSVDRIAVEVDRVAADTARAAELYQTYLSRGDIV
ncbi:MAG: hypothetical protein E7501_02395 [Ruminococcus sp.]|nr:hypothetical protein [Ruminococcus sp.]MBQ8906919.1 hypothetical protein [Ruminococcus sp.]